MLPNFGIVALSALVPLFIGFVWYNPKVFGNAWMKAASVSEEKIKSSNMPVIFILTYLFSLMLGVVLFSIVVHQTGLFSLFADEPGFMKEGSETMLQLDGLMEDLGNKFRTFKHGAFHGAVTALFIVLPVMGTNALFERKGFKYIAVNVGYWVVCLTIMGGILCQWA